MSDETQIPQGTAPGTSVPVPDAGSAPVQTQDPNVVPAAVPPAIPSDPVAPAVVTPPQSDTPVAQNLGAQAEPEEDFEGPAVTDVPSVEVLHAYDMVSAWRQRAEAGLHISIDELRALEARLAVHLTTPTA